MKKLNLKGQSGPPPASASTRRQQRPGVNSRLEAYWNIASDDVYSGWSTPQHAPFCVSVQPKYANISGNSCVVRYDDCTCNSEDHRVEPTYSTPTWSVDERVHIYEYTSSGAYNKPPHSPDTFCIGEDTVYSCCSDLTPDYCCDSFSEEDERDSEDRQTTFSNKTSFPIKKVLNLSDSKRINPALRDSAKKPTSKLKRRQAYYRERKQGRSRSLTHIDRMDLDKDETDSRSDPPENQNERLLLPIPGEVESRHLRRKKLTGSQVCSSEYFSVHFEDELGCKHEEFLPATRGISVGDALRPLLEKQHLALGKVDVFVEPSSKTPLPSPSATDTYLVAGKNLIIRPKTIKQDSKFHCRSFKDTSRKRGERGKSGFFGGSSAEDSTFGGATGVEHVISSNSLTCTQHPPSVRHGSSTSTSASHEGSLKVKLSKQSNRWSGLFSNSAKDNTKMELLAEQLNSYSLHGIPGSTLSDENEDEGKYVIEDDVRSIVSDWDSLSERGQKQQTAIWELVETEVVYLKTVKVITDLFLFCLYNLQGKNILNEIDREKLFSNIPQIHESNRSLWLNSLYPMVEKARLSHQPLKPSELRNGFLEFGGTCSPYIRYCLDQTKCQRYCREKYHENEFFKAYLAWCETRKECNRLRLMDILVRPMQRMTKYSLLLKAILKHTECPVERQDLEEMIASVETFVLSVNGALRNRQEAERLKGISERIEAYDVVETREEELEGLVRKHSNLDLFHPMPRCGGAGRAFLFEGDLKVKDATGKIDAHCLLFTDMLLICKSTGRKGEKVKVVRPPMTVDCLLIKELSKDPNAFGLVYLNEYGTPTAACTLHANDSKMVKIWLDNIKKAQKLYAEARQRETADFPGDVLEEQDSGWNTTFLTSSRFPRENVSSYTSQLSSLVHSHSGSIEMEGSNVPSRGVSFENEHRASSFSSDDANNGVSGESCKRSPSNDQGQRMSPRIERRTFLSKSPTPNRLSVKVPTGQFTGQSLPNLSSASETIPHTYSIHSLVVPKGFLSPTHRGVSYPPPSPRNLTRSEALTRNPPLIKSRNISSTDVAAKVDTNVVDIMVPNLKKISGVPHEVSETMAQRRQSDTCQKSENDPNPVTNPPKRLTRSERSDVKRYYTAGAIEDIKKEVLKDSSIYKRLSWNCGTQQDEHGGGKHHFKNQQYFSIESMPSVRSSSGVSSTTSLFLCGGSDSDKIQDHKISPTDVSINVSSDTCAEPGTSSAQRSMTLQHFTAQQQLTNETPSLCARNESITESSDL